MSHWRYVEVSQAKIAPVFRKSPLLHTEYPSLKMWECMTPFGIFIVHSSFQVHTLYAVC